MLFFREPVVVVQEFAVGRDDVGLALAADAAAAEIGRIDAGRFDGFEQALLLADAYLLAADGKRDVEGQAWLRRRKMLVMRVLRRPAGFGGGAAHPVDHWGGAADVEMRAERLRGEQALKLDLLAAVVVIEVDALAVAFLQHVAIG